MADEIDDESTDGELPEGGEEAGAGDESNAGYRIGYRKPPRHSQFKPGQSGNPRGRKKGSRGLKTDLDAELKRVVEVKVGNYRFKGTTQQLTLRTLALLAANGNLKASAQLVPMILTVFGTEDRGAEKRTLSPQDQAALDNFLTAFGGEADDSCEAGDSSAAASGDGSKSIDPPQSADPCDDMADEDQS